MDELELIAKLGSAVPAHDAHARARAAERLTTHITTRGRRPGRRVVLIAAATAACLAVAAVVAARLADHDAARPPATRVITPIPGRIPVDGIWYQRVDNTFLAIVDDAQPFSYTSSSTREIWVRADGSGRVVDVPRGTHFLTEADRAAWVRGGRKVDLHGTRSDQLVPPGGVPNSVALMNYTIGHTPLTYEQMLGLPDDPDQLARRIADEARKCECGPSLDEEQFEIVHDLLRAPAIPAKLRLGLLGAAQRLPTIDPVGTATDSLGRRGIAISRMTERGRRIMLILDPATGTLLGDREVTVRRGAIQRSGAIVPANTVVGDSTYVTEGLVDSLSERLP